MRFRLEVYDASRIRIETYLPELLIHTHFIYFINTHLFCDFLLHFENQINEKAFKLNDLKAFNSS